MDLDNEVKLKSRIRKNWRDLYCICIVVDTEKLSTNVGMLSNIRCDSKMAVSSALLFQTCELHILIVLLYKYNKQILITLHRPPSEQKQKRPFNP